MKRIWACVAAMLLALCLPAIRARAEGRTGGMLRERAEQKHAVSVDPADPLLTLASPAHPIPDDWQPELVDIGKGMKVDSRMYDDLMAMLAAAEAEGYAPIVCSAYRTHDKQAALYENKVRRCRAEGLSPADAEIEAARWVAVPDTSEHQLGLAVDIVSKNNQNLDESQLDNPAQQWLMAHCWEYGFILRYPADKTEITGIGHEPWHYRYVGRQAAAEICRLGVCLEEYLEWLEAGCPED